MTDHHLHIGQFNELYYNPLEIFSIIDSISDKTNITEVHYSSTSSCRFDAELSGVEEEIEYAQSFSSKTLTVKPYLWFIPKYATQNIHVKEACKSFDYCGIKLHPFAQNWDLQDEKHTTALHEIFSWADENKKAVLIHCGPKPCDLPDRFESFFPEYPDSQIILAHSNPAELTATLVNKYKNVYCDTAACEAGRLKKIFSLVNDKNKILFGSDFPITHYFNERLFDKHNSLEQEYFNECNSYIRCKK